MKECESTSMVPCKSVKFSQCSLPCAIIKALRWQGREQMEVPAPHSGEETQQEEQEWNCQGKAANATFAESVLQTRKGT